MTFDYCPKCLAYQPTDMAGNCLCCKRKRAPQPVNWPGYPRTPNEPSRPRGPNDRPHACK